MAGWRVRKFVSVPDTWEGWAIRVLTVAVVLTLAVQCLLWRELHAVHTYIEQSRVNREHFQDDQREFMRKQEARTCDLIRHNDRYDELGALGC